MADYTSKAQIILTVNGKQAEKILKDLEKRASTLREKMDAAAKIGDKGTVQKLASELKKVERQIAQIKGASKSVEQVLQSLDKSSPRQLNRALAQMRKELEGIERGSDAWKAHMEKIKAVKAEIQRMNAEMGQQRTRWQRMNDWLNETQTFITALAAAITGLVMAGRKAVNSYAEMEEQLANTRKYTGMTVQEVQKLNEAFQQMDTRTGRDKLNELAQEAGRLGKNTLESVKGYVEAADIINVALVDLGAGATQTIAKLTNIFGVEQALGTKKAMLSVGSAVNVLSQNCTASKPYLVEFAQRMAGIGSQAGLTVPQILAFGAVLDANGQKVEMSATAIQKVIMNLANKNQEFAKVVGLNADMLNKTLKHSAKDGLLMFLEALQKIGKSAGFENATLSIAPAFKEMGLDAARVSQVLSTLAMHLDEVKWQMGEADKAFREATSATKEYEIFNNTAQAAIDKARARVKELAIELGEELYPVMKHIYTTSGVFMRVLNSIVSFVIKNKTEIAALCAGIAAYSIAITLATIKTKALSAATAAGSAIMATWTTITKSLALVLAICTSNTDRARAAWRALNTAFKASVIGLIVAALTMLIAKLVSINKEAKEFRKSMDEAMQSSTSFAEAAQNEIKKIDRLVGVLESAKKESKEYQKAKDEIISKYGVYLKGLINEAGEITNLADAYDRLTFAAQKSAQARGIANAKENLSNTYFQEVDRLTEELRILLEKWKTPERDITRIVTKVSQEMALGRPIPEDVVLEVRDIEGKHKSGSIYKSFFEGSAVKILNSLEKNRNEYNVREQKLDRMDNRYFQSLTDEDLKSQIESLQKAMTSNTPNEKIEVSIQFDKEMDASRVVSVFDKAEKVTKEAGKVFELYPNKGEAALNYHSLDEQSKRNFDAMPKYTHTMELSSNSSGKYIAKGVVDRVGAEDLMREYLYELMKRGGEKESKEGSGGNGKQLTFADETETKKEDKFKVEKEWREKMEAYNRIAYATGKKDYISYMKEMDRIEVEYQKKRLKHDDLEQTERLTIRAEYYEAVKKRDERVKAESIEKENSLHDQQVSSIKSMYIEGFINKEQYDEKMEKEEMHHQYALLQHFEKGSKEYLAAQEKLKDMQIADMKKRQQETERLEKQYADVKAQFFGDNAQELETKMNAELSLLEIVYNREIKAMENNAKEKLRIEEAYQKAKEAIRKKYAIAAGTATSAATSLGLDWLDDAGEWLSSDTGKAVVGSVQNAVSSMSSMMSQLTSLVQAELDMQCAAIEKRYDKELERAEGNSYQIAQIEKRKEAELAKIKNEANKKMYNMQVAQAIAQTAQNAISAYGSAVSIPIVGTILAPIAAAAAIAAGAIQIASIKKQQAVSEASGYAEGGFTADGDKHQPAGIVHAGEWVASQKLVKNPVIRPILNTLEYAQKNNIMPSMSMNDVSMRLAAPAIIANSRPAEDSGTELRESIEKLNRRLNDPFVTVATIAGDKGIEREKKRYDRLMKNKG